jgi:hypothetical protein
VGGILGVRERGKDVAVERRGLEPRGVLQRCEVGCFLVTELFANRQLVGKEIN